jgi:cytochrome c peroxidase
MPMRRITCAERVAIAAAVAVLGVTTSSTPVRAAEAQAAVRSDEASRFVEQYRRPAAPPFPADNAFTPERAELGRKLFFDPRLSGSNFISCASCHNPGFAWGDALPKAIGHGMNQLTRRTPTVLNVAWAPALFWDGRASTLEEQALGPITSPGEMNLPTDVMIGRLAELPAYAEWFRRAYPGEPLAPATVAKAIATFERTVVSAKAPFDEFIDGKVDAISPDARRGFVLFNTKAQCAKCHEGWRFTDDGFHDIGARGTDRGRGALVDLPTLQFAFKTPTLRNVDRRAPYMHDGSEPTLEAVIDLYDRGGREKRSSLSGDIRPLDLTGREKKDLLAFLRTLTSDDQPVTVPTLPR